MGKSKTDTTVHLEDLARKAAEERARDAAEAAALRKAAAELLGPDGDRWTAH